MKSQKTAGAQSAKTPERSVKAFDAVHTTSKDKRAFGVRITGDAMAPEFPDGVTVVFEPGRKPRSGDAVIVRLADGRAGFVYYRQNGKRVILSRTKGILANVAASEVRYAYPAIEIVFGRPRKPELAEPEAKR